jgi:hypothetical protein
VIIAKIIIGLDQITTLASQNAQLVIPTKLGSQ